MNRAVFRYVEAELYDYPWTKQEIARLRVDIALEGSGVEAALLAQHVSGGQQADPTLAKTIRLLTNRRLKRMEETVAAIERVYDRLPPEKQRLVDLKYWQRYSNLAVATRLHISRATFYRWRAEVVTAVAVELGLANAVELLSAGLAG
ncbi:MAG: transcriptional regulator [Firmicutes bacterium]|nr:transcriptional regulator [Bacillota bacterium]